MAYDPRNSGSTRQPEYTDQIEYDSWQGQQSPSGFPGGYHGGVTFQQPPLPPPMEPALQAHPDDEWGDWPDDWSVEDPDPTLKTNGVSNGFFSQQPIQITRTVPQLQQPGNIFTQYTAPAKPFELYTKQALNNVPQMSVKAGVSYAAALSKNAEDNQELKKPSSDFDDISLDDNADDFPVQTQQPKPMSLTPPPEPIVMDRSTSHFFGQTNSNNFWEKDVHVAPKPKQQNVFAQPKFPMDFFGSVNGAPMQPPVAQQTQSGAPEFVQPSPTPPMVYQSPNIHQSSDLVQLSPTPPVNPVQNDYPIFSQPPGCAGPDLVQPGSTPPVVNPPLDVQSTFSQPPSDGSELVQPSPTLPVVNPVQDDHPLFSQPPCAGPDLVVNPPLDVQCTFSQPPSDGPELVYPSPIPPVVNPVQDDHPVFSQPPCAGPDLVVNPPLDVQTTFSQPPSDGPELVHLSPTPPVVNPVQDDHPVFSQPPCAGPDLVVNPPLDVQSIFSQPTSDGLDTPLRDDELHLDDGNEPEEGLPAIEESAGPLAKELHTYHEHFGADDSWDSQPSGATPDLSESESSAGTSSDQSQIEASAWNDDELTHHTTLEPSPPEIPKYSGNIFTPLPTARFSDAAAIEPPTARPYDEATAVPPIARSSDPAAIEPPTARPYDEATAVPPTARSSDPAAIEPFTARPYDEATSVNPTASSFGSGLLDFPNYSSSVFTPPPAATPDKAAVHPTARPYDEATSVHTTASSFGGGPPQLSNIFNPEEARYGDETSTPPPFNTSGAPTVASQETRDHWHSTPPSLSMAGETSSVETSNYGGKISIPPPPNTSVAPTIASQETRDHWHSTPPSPSMAGETSSMETSNYGGKISIPPPPNTSGAPTIASQETRDYRHSTLPTLSMAGETSFMETSNYGGKISIPPPPNTSGAPTVASQETRDHWHSTPPSLTMAGETSSVETSNYGGKISIPPPPNTSVAPTIASQETRDYRHSTLPNLSMAGETSFMETSNYGGKISIPPPPNTSVGPTIASQETRDYRHSTRPTLSMAGETSFMETSSYGGKISIPPPPNTSGAPTVASQETRDHRHSTPPTMSMAGETSSMETSNYGGKISIPPPPNTSGTPTFASQETRDHRHTTPPSLSMAGETSSMETSNYGGKISIPPPPNTSGTPTFASQETRDHRHTTPPSLSMAGETSSMETPISIPPPPHTSVAPTIASQETRDHRHTTPPSLSMAGETSSMETSTYGGKILTPPPPNTSVVHRDHKAFPTDIPKTDDISNVHQNTFVETGETKSDTPPLPMVDSNKMAMSFRQPRERKSRTPVAMTSSLWSSSASTGAQPFMLAPALMDPAKVAQQSAVMYHPVGPQNLASTQLEEKGSMITACSPIEHEVSSSGYQPVTPVRNPYAHTPPVSHSTPVLSQQPGRVPAIPIPGHELHSQPHPQMYTSAALSQQPTDLPADQPTVSVPTRSLVGGPTLPAQSIPQGLPVTQGLPLSVTSGGEPVPLSPTEMNVDNPKLNKKERKAEKKRLKAMAKEEKKALKKAAAAAGSGAGNQETNPDGVTNNMGNPHGPVKNEHENPTSYGNHGNHGSPYGVAPGNPHGATEGNPHGATEGNPHGATEGNPHGATEGNPHGATEGNPHGSLYGNPHGTVLGNPHGVVPGNPHGAVSGNPHGTILGNPHGAISGNHHGAISGNPYGVVPGNPHGAISGNPPTGNPHDNIRNPENPVQQSKIDHGNLDNVHSVYPHGVYPHGNTGNPHGKTLDAAGNPDHDRERSHHSRDDVYRNPVEVYHSDDQYSRDSREPREERHVDHHIDQDSGRRRSDTTPYDNPRIKELKDEFSYERQDRSGSRSPLQHSEFRSPEEHPHRRADYEYEHGGGYPQRNTRDEGVQRGNPHGYGAYYDDNARYSRDNLDRPRDRSAASSYDYPRRERSRREDYNYKYETNRSSEDLSYLNQSYDNTRPDRSSREELEYYNRRDRHRDEGQGDPNFKPIHDNYDYKDSYRAHTPTSGSGHSSPSGYDYRGYDHGYYQHQYPGYHDPRYGYYGHYGMQYPYYPYPYHYDPYYQHYGQEYASGHGAYPSGEATSYPDNQQTQEQEAPGEQPAHEDHQEEEVQGISPFRTTPLHFIRPHMSCSFGAGGQMLVVLPNHPHDGMKPLVDIQKLKVVFTADEKEQIEAFPGPLTCRDTMKKQVIEFIQFKSDQIQKSTFNLASKQARWVLWKFFLSLVKHNGAVVTDDIAETLIMSVTLFEKKKKKRHSSTDSSATDTSTDSSTDSTSSESSSNDDSSEDESEHQQDKPVDHLLVFRGHLLKGHSKEALEYAMKNGLWGHAVLASGLLDNKGTNSLLDTKTSSGVIQRFFETLEKGDPLVTVYEHLGGKVPQSLRSHENWASNLAAIVANPTAFPDKDKENLITLGDSLAKQQDLLFASHLCYLLAGIKPGPPGPKAKIVLIGCDHRNKSLEKIATIESLQLTELFEYATSLENPEFYLQNLQIFKYFHAVRLVDAGMQKEALSYLHNVGDLILKNPFAFNNILQRNVYKTAEQLVGHMEKNSQGVELFILNWLKKLNNLIEGTDSGIFEPQKDVPSDEDEVEDPLAQSSVSFYSGYDSSLISHAEKLSPSESTGLVDVASRTSSILSTHSTTETPPVSMAHAPLSRESSLQSMQSSVAPLQTLDLSQPLPSQIYQPREPVAHKESFSSHHSEDQPDGSHVQEDNFQGNLPYQGVDNQMPWMPPQQDNNMSSGGMWMPGVPQQNNWPSGIPGQGGEVLPGSEGEKTPVNTGTFDEFYLQANPIANSVQPRWEDESSMTPTPGMQEISPPKQEPPLPSEPMPKQEQKKPTQKNTSGGWFTGLTGLIQKVIPKGPKEVHLPDDSTKTIYFDKEKNKWINTEESEEDRAPPPPPPTDAMISGMMGAPPPVFGNPPSGPPPMPGMPTSTSLPGRPMGAMPTTGSMPINANSVPGNQRPDLGAAPSPPGPGNRPFGNNPQEPQLPGMTAPGMPAAPPSMFSRKAQGRLSSRNKYVDVLNPNKKSSDGPPAIPSALFPIMPTAAGGAFQGTFFVPSAAPSEDNADSSSQPPSSIQSGNEDTQPPISTPTHSRTSSLGSQQSTVSLASAEVQSYFDGQNEDTESHNNEPQAPTNMPQFFNPSSMQQQMPTRRGRYPYQR